MRYESHHTNFTIYATKDLIPKGLLPKCNPAIHSDNPLFWRKWNENLNNLARKQLQLLLEETHNHIKLLTTLLSNQLEDLRTSVNNHSTYTILTTLIENMAFNLSNNLNSLRTKKLKRMPPTDINNDASNQPAENNPTSMNNAERTDAENTNPVRNVITAPSDPPNRNTANSTSRTPTNVNQHKKNRRTRSQNNNISQPYIHTYFIYSRSRLYIQIKLRRKVLLEKEVWRLALCENSLK